ncbi:MAG: methyltransferase domain-containing protein [Chromatiales bacterium]|nr:methyltransferase domain-containing protein [Chromatiales bacterium]
MKLLAQQLACPLGEAGSEVADRMTATNALIIARCIDALAPQAGETIAEIGPGNGLLSQPIAQALGETGHYIGIEHSALMATKIAENLDTRGGCAITLHQCDYQLAPVNRASLDGLMAVNLLYFIQDLPTLFSTLMQWLKPGGRLVLGVRSAQVMQQFPFSRFGFINREIEEIEQGLLHAGFTDCTSANYVEGSVTLDEATLPIDSLIFTAHKPK